MQKPIKNKQYFVPTILRVATFILFFYLCFNSSSVNPSMWECGVQNNPAPLGTYVACNIYTYIEFWHVTHQYTTKLTLICNSSYWLFGCQLETIKDFFGIDSLFWFRVANMFSARLLESFRDYYFLLFRESFRASSWLFTEL